MMNMPCSALPTVVDKEVFGKVFSEADRDGYRTESGTYPVAWVDQIDDKPRFDPTFLSFTC